LSEFSANERGELVCPSCAEDFVPEPEAENRFVPHPDPLPGGEGTAGQYQSVVSRPMGFVARIGRFEAARPGWHGLWGGLAFPFSFVQFWSGCTVCHWQFRSETVSFRLRPRIDTN